MKVDLVRVDKASWKELSSYSAKAIQKGIATHVYNDGIMFTRALIKEQAGQTAHMVVLVGSENAAENAYRLCRAFVDVNASLTGLGAI